MGREPTPPEPPKEFGLNVCVVVVGPQEKSKVKSVLNDVIFFIKDNSSPRGQELFLTHN
jgi:hypothetical protein